MSFRRYFFMKRATPTPPTAPTTMPIPAVTTPAGAPIILPIFAAAVMLVA